MSKRKKPSFDLNEVKRLVENGAWRATRSAVDDARKLQFDRLDIVECIREVTVVGDFYKTMESTKLRGLMQDVYRPCYCGVKIYLKVQIQQIPNGSQAVVVSFKEDDNAEQRGLY